MTLQRKGVAIGRPDPLAVPARHAHRAPDRGGAHEVGWIERPRFFETRGNRLEPVRAHPSGPHDAQRPRELRAAAQLGHAIRCARQRLGKRIAPRREREERHRPVAVELLVEELGQDLLDGIGRPCAVRRDPQAEGHAGVPRPPDALLDVPEARRPVQDVARLGVECHRFAQVAIEIDDLVGRIVPQPLPQANPYAAAQDERDDRVVKALGQAARRASEVAEREVTSDRMPRAGSRP
jgi:hypothetical protein